MTAEQIKQGISDLGPWFYRFDFPGGLSTTSIVPDSVVDIFETRLRMVNQAIDAHFGPPITVPVPSVATLVPHALRRIPPSLPNRL